MYWSISRSYWVQRRSVCSEKFDPRFDKPFRSLLSQNRKSLKEFWLPKVSMYARVQHEDLPSFKSRAQLLQLWLRNLLPMWPFLEPHEFRLSVKTLERYLIYRAAARYKVERSVYVSAGMDFHR